MMFKIQNCSGNMKRSLFSIKKAVVWKKFKSLYPDTVIVKFPLGQTKDGTDHADIALEMGKALIGESVIAIPSTTYENTPPKWDLNYLLDDKRGEMFLSALTFFENKMLRGMFVPERTITQDSSSKAGSYSLSQTHADMFLLGEEALLVDIENELKGYGYSCCKRNC